MRRLTIVIGAVLLSVPLGAPEAVGGGNFLEVNRRYLAPGQTAVASNRYFTRAIARNAPYYLYLLRAEDGWDPPLEAFRAAPVLGRARIAWPGPHRDWSGEMKGNPRLTVRLEVPQLPPGNYLLGLCDLPCEHRIHSISFGSIRIVASPLEARLRTRIDRTESRIWTLRGALGRNRRIQTQQSRDLDGRIGAVGAASSRSAAALDDRLSALDAETRRAAGSAHRANLVGAGALLLAAGALVLRRRRTPAFSSPDPAGWLDDDIDHIEVTVEEPVLTGSGAAG